MQTSVNMLVFFFLALFTVKLERQKNLTPRPQIDVQSYIFDIKVTDENDSLHAQATVLFTIVLETQTVILDLASIKGNGKGMKVLSVKEGTKSLSFTHQHDEVHIKFREIARAGDSRSLTITYTGIPADGLIIAKNKYNHRTFFADNWPNRAHNWLACVDHPSDKAAVEFIVTAPTHYQVIANGELVEETNISITKKLTHYRETVPLPMKVAVIGIADFAMQVVGEVNGIPVQSWVYPEDREKGFGDYAQAMEVLPFFIQYIGPYAYKKLANVQSKTIFGGMENAGAIFYFENSVTGKHEMESLLAHEIAHQWFGNMATETQWSHIWLSEGFATYLTQLYLEKKYGTDTLKKRMAEDRKEVINYTGRKTGPVVDSTVTNYMQLLNANSYQKGGWVLHMLRNKVGDPVFWKGLRSYYARFAGKNASSEDFRMVMEEVSGIELKKFFTDWLYTAGHPQLAITWRYDQNRKLLLVTVEQQQKNLFDFPLAIQVSSSNDALTKAFFIKERETILSIPFSVKPRAVVVDPDVQLLFEGSVKEK